MVLVAPGGQGFTELFWGQEGHTRHLNLHSTALKTFERCLRTTTGANLTEPVVVLSPLLTDSTCQGRCSEILVDPRTQPYQNMFGICVVAFVIEASFSFPT